MLLLLVLDCPDAMVVRLQVLVRDFFCFYSIFWPLFPEAGAHPPTGRQSIARTPSESSLLRFRAWSGDMVLLLIAYGGDDKWTMGCGWMRIWSEATVDTSLNSSQTYNEAYLVLYKSYLLDFGHWNWNICVLSSYSLHYMPMRTEPAFKLGFVWAYRQQCAISGVIIFHRDVVGNYD